MELASLYTVPLSADNGLSRLNTYDEQGAGTAADLIQKFLNLPIPF